MRQTEKTRKKHVSMVYTIITTNASGDELERSPEFTNIIDARVQFMLAKTRCLTAKEQILFSQAMADELAKIINSKL